MAESVQVAVSVAARLIGTGQRGVLAPQCDARADTRLHVHLWHGGQRKDGPSAGVAFLVAVISAMACVPPVPHCVSGEITLGGEVLAVGDVRAKSHAAAACLGRDPETDLGDGADNVSSRGRRVVVLPSGCRVEAEGLPGVERGVGVVGMRVVYAE